MPPPDRWTDYQPLGSVIPGTKFIAFKVPLKEALCKNLSAGERFSPSSLIQILKESGQNLGLVVDLTFTSKYYNGKEFTEKSIDYKKIFTAGHEIPSEEIFLRFEEIVSGFCAKNADNNILIGIHCTHGVNRTGYLICRYMIEKLNFKPDDAISKFNEARGHPIERENYIEDLRKRPFERSPEEPQNFPPPSPERKKRKPRHKKKKMEKSKDSFEETQPAESHGHFGSSKKTRSETSSREHRKKHYQDGHGHSSRCTSHVSPLEVVESSEMFQRGCWRAGWGSQIQGTRYLEYNRPQRMFNPTLRMSAFRWGEDNGRSEISYHRNAAYSYGSREEITRSSGYWRRYDNQQTCPPWIHPSNIRYLNSQDRRPTHAEQKRYQVKDHHFPVNHQQPPS